MPHADRAQGSAETGSFSLSCSVPIRSQRAVGGGGSTVAEGHRAATRSAVEAVPPTVTTLADRSEAGATTRDRPDAARTRSHNPGPAEPRTCFAGVPCQGEPLILSLVDHGTAGQRVSCGLWITCTVIVTRTRSSSDRRGRGMDVVIAGWTQSSNQRDHRWADATVVGPTRSSSERRDHR